MEQENEKPKKLRRKEKRKRWKEARRGKRAREKEYYRYAPWGTRIWNLYLKKPLGRLLVVAIVIGLLADGVQSLLASGGASLASAILKAANAPLTDEQKEELYRQAPIDEEGAAKIDAAAIPLGEDENWTICVYIVGSNVEDFGENDISPVMSYQIADTKKKNSDDSKNEVAERYHRFQDELKENGLGLPAYFYDPVTPVASTKQVTEDVTVAGDMGFGSEVIKGLTGDVWPDNVSIVFQTGGAMRWNNRMVNPNRTQRFEYRGGELTEVANMPAVPSSVPETLADFLRFCKEEYPSDHRMLILWDHGGGPFGYGFDTLYNTQLSLKDIRSALKSVYRPNSQDPPFDIIGFDACLMANLDVVHALDGFADFFCLSEESEPAPGWNHDAWLQALKDNSTMAPSQIARTVADSFVDYFVGRGIRMSLLSTDVTFSVLDAHKTEALYEAYSALAEAQLKDAVTDRAVPAELGRCAVRSTRFGGTDADVFNTIDLGNYVDQLTDSYPEECARIKELMNEAVLYHRQNGAMTDATGISVYFPAEVDTLYGLSYYQNYIYNICESKSVAALYYYKQAGCLPEEQREYVKELTGSEPKTLDLTPFQAFSGSVPEFDSEGILLPVSEELQNMMVSYHLEVARLDPESNSIVNYGSEEAIRLDGEGHLVSEFDGRWVCINGIPLSVEVLSSTASAVQYRAPVKYNRTQDAWLMISRDRDTDELTVTGFNIRKDNNANDMLASHSTMELKSGDKIAPVYEVVDRSTRMVSGQTGKWITYSDRMDLEFRPLPDGDYVSAAVITDQRGDSYYSAVAGSTLSKGLMKDWQSAPDFYGRSY